MLARIAASRVAHEQNSRAFSVNAWLKLESAVCRRNQHRPRHRRFAASIASRSGTGIRSLAEQFDAKPAEIRQLLRGGLDAGRTRELMDCAQFGFNTDHGAFEVCAVSLRAEVAQSGNP